MIEVPLISVIIPVLNEERNITRAYDSIKSVFESLDGRFRLEVIFSDNHSTDATYGILQELTEKDRRVRVIRLSRNFGFQRSLLTAYLMSHGDAAIQIDCDLQDPPSLIPVFLDLWCQGHDVVAGVRRKRPEPFLLHLGRKIFYRLLCLVSDDNMIEDAGDFRLVDRSVIERLRKVNDARPYTRGLISSFSASQIGVPYERVERKAGKSKFPIRRLFGFAVDGLVNHSMLPLRIATVFGIAAFILSLALLFWYVLSFLLFGTDWPDGFATLTTLLLASIGFNSLLVGVLGEYVGRIFEQVRYRPLSIIEKKINFDDQHEGDCE